LVAVLVAAVTAVITFLGCAAVGFKASSCVVLTAVGFFAPLGGVLALLFGPDDYDCEAELAEVTGLLPEAKRVRDQWRAARRAERAARKQAAAGGDGLVERAVTDPAETKGLAELVPVGGPPPVPAALEGDGTYAVPVLGEVHIGRILADVCHDELPPVGQDEIVSAVVRIENTNRDSRAAVGGDRRAEGRAPVPRRCPGAAAGGLGQRAVQVPGGHPRHVEMRPGPLRPAAGPQLGVRPPQRGRRPVIA
jgi:hypothetical protein